MPRKPDGQHGKDLRALKKYLAVARGRTLEEIREQFEIDERVAHRWLTHLEQDGVSIVRLGIGRPVKYAVLGA